MQATNNMHKTSIIIPTYNARDLLKDCLYAIKRHTPQPYEIIVVDNGSTDGTSDICRQEQVTFISMPDNAGFPAACNRGLKIASGDTLLLLNNDVLVTKNWLPNMLACLYSQDDIGIVGPYTNFASGRQQIEMPAGNEIENVANPQKWLQVERIVGLCFLFKRGVLEKLGLLDERFSPGHYEDDDYCMRARHAGYRFMIAGDVFVFHLGSASFSQQDQTAVQQLIGMNRQKFIDKWGIDPAIYI